MREEVDRAVESTGDPRETYWADGPCPRWCDNDHPVSRNHLSTFWICDIILSTEDPTIETVDNKRVHCPKKIQAYIEQNIREIGPRVVVREERTGEPEFSLLPAEALHLGMSLSRLGTMAAENSKLEKCQSCGAPPRNQQGLPRRAARVYY
jgi:hypothetical protein